jgi:hypothetical protein
MVAERKSRGRARTTRTIRGHLRGAPPDFAEPDLPLSLISRASM